MTHDKPTGLNILKARFVALPGNVQGAFWIFASAFMFTAMATIIKFLGGRLPTIEIAFFRALAGLIIILPFMIKGAGTSFRTRRPVLHLVRGLFGSLGMICNFYAFVHLPLATANAISFSRALFLVPLAVFFAGEAFGYRRAAATFVGFIGVLIILRPSADMDPAALVAVVSALAIAGAAICVKNLSRTDAPQTLLFYSSVIGLFATAVPALFAWVAPTLAELALLALMGLFGTMAHTCFIKAYGVGEVSALAPYEYTRLLLAALVGFWVFGNLPDMWTWVGAAVIIGTSLYITLREVQVARQSGEMGQKPAETRDL